MASLQDSLLDYKRNNKGNTIVKLTNYPTGEFVVVVAVDLTVVSE